MGETVQRILSGICLAALVIGALYFRDLAGGLTMFGLIFLFSFFGLLEFYRLADRGYEGRPFVGLGVVFCILIVLSFYLRAAGFLGFSRWLADGKEVLLVWLLLFMICAFCAQAIFRPLDGAIYNVSVTLFGGVYIGLPLLLLPAVLNLEHGMFYLVLIILSATMTDTGAYFTGRLFGRHRVGLKLSPNKTYEGYVGGIVFANLVMQGFLWYWNAHVARVVMGHGELFGFALVLSVFAIFGDLAESALKRDAKLKDSASVIPGHGGVLDLVDAVLFTLPPGYFYLSVFS